MLADITPRVLGLRPGTWIAILALVAGTILVLVVTRSLRGWRRFAARHRLTMGKDRIQGDIAGRRVDITLVHGDGPPKTRVVIGAFEREAVGRMNEAALERALTDAELAQGQGRGTSTPE